MKEPSALDKKIVTEIMQFLAHMGNKIEREFPKYHEQIARAFVITGANRLQREHGAEAAGEALFEIGAALEEASALEGTEPENPSPTGYN